MKEKSSFRMKLILPVFLVWLSLSYLHASIIYVDVSANGANDGSSWIDAYMTLQDALILAVPNDSIFVAQGIYYPDEGGGQTNNDRNASFTIPDSVIILGGYPSGGGTLASRDFTLYSTTLSGDIDQGSGNSNNSYHIISTGSVSDLMTLDGFYIENANGSGVFGGGWLNHGSPTVENCFFVNNVATSGAGMFNDGSSGGASNPTYVNCRFDNNVASNIGGALVNYGDGGTSSPLLVNCVFTSNSATYGGAMLNDAYYGGANSTRVINCTFYNNSATTSGSVMASFGTFGSSSPSIENCIVWNNGGSVIANFNATTLVNHSLYEGNFSAGTSGANNVFSDPLFVSTTDLRLTICSPALNMADSSKLPTSVEIDLLGNDRVVGSEVDMGAYEFQSIIGATKKFYVDSSVQNGDGLTWATAFNHLQDVLTIGCLSEGDSVFVAQGTYYPDEGSNPVGNDRTATFHVPSGVVILGGFPTGGSDLVNRNYEIYETILSGNIDQSADSLNNSYHVVTTTNASSATIVDGLLITDGNANSTSSFRGDDGGGWLNHVAVVGNVSSPTIRNCTFFNNAAADDGGAFYNGADEGQASPNFMNCKFINNHAGSAGAIYNRAEAAAIMSIYVDCEFSLNSSSYRAGAIQNYADDANCSPSFTRCTFDHNSTIEGQGGAMYNEAYVGDCSPLISTCEFYNNSTNTKNYFNNSYHGGAIYNVANDATCAPIIQHCTFFGNKANQADGGAIYNYGDYEEGLCAPIIMHCKFDSNHASNGGAIHSYAEDNPCKITIVNSVFLDNVANSEGGALFNFGENQPCLVSITSSSFSNNNAGDGYAIFNRADEEDFCNVYLSNSIIWNYEEQEDNIYHDGDACLFATYNIYQGEYPDDTDTMGVSSIRAIPGFISLRDLRLQACSPAIDAGISDSIPSGVTMDLDSNIRIYNGAVDIGAYEYQSTFTNPSIFFVDASATGGDGYSWSTALTKLQDALNLACFESSDTICVAQGIYYPDEGLFQIDDHKDQSFLIKSETVLLGGFPSGGGSLSSRDYILNKTTLSGDIDQALGNTNNAETVVVSTNASSTTVFDGFYIVDGGDGGGEAGGWYNRSRDEMNISSPTISNTVFKNNVGFWSGAMRNTSNNGTECSPHLANCSFVNNSSLSIYSGGGGGAISFVGSGRSIPIIENCKFVNNAADNFRGGAILNQANNHGFIAPQIINCIFQGNSAAIAGGAICNFGNGGVCTPNFINCSMSGNAAPMGGAIFNTIGSGVCNVAISNSILWENGSDPMRNDMAMSRFSHSIYQGTLPNGTVDMGGNLNLNPLFISMTDLSLFPCSPAINAGVNDSIPGFITTDINNEDRIFDIHVDMGAYEYQDEYIDITTLYVDSSAVAGVGGSWADAHNYLQDALNSPCLDVGDTIQIAQGTYYPDDGINQIDNDRSMTFDIPSGIVVLGGFKSGGSSLSNRYYSLHQTVLSGDIDQNDSLTLNSHHVVTTINVADSTIVNGLYIRDGNATVSGQHGGGWYNLSDGIGQVSNPKLLNCVFENNNSKYRGGAFFNYSINNGSTAPDYSACVFSNNAATISGGAVYNSTLTGSCLATFNDCLFEYNAGSGAAVYNNGKDTMSPTFINCSFIANNSDNSPGGAVYNFGSNENSTILFANCDFIGNYGGTGGAMYNSLINGGNKTINIINCSFSGNKSTNFGGAISNTGNTTSLNVVIANSIFWGNDELLGGEIYSGISDICEVSHSVLEDIPDPKTALSGYISYDDPLFVLMPDHNHAPTSIGNLDLLYGSSRINHGIDSLIPSGITVDIDGNDRIINSIIDIGSHEFDYYFPCGQYDTLLVDEIPVFNGTYRASGLISSVGEVNANSDGDVIFESQISIELKNGFEVKLGEEFEAVIQTPCSEP